MSIESDAAKNSAAFDKLAEAIANLGDIPPAAFKPALVRAAQPYLARVKSTAPSSSIAASFGIFPSRRRDGTLWIGPRYVNGRTKGTMPAGNLTHIFEKGTKERFQKKGLRAGGITQKGMKKFGGSDQLAPKEGKSTGKITATHFVSKAFQSSKREMETTLLEGVEKIIEKWARKLGFETKAA